MESVAWRPIIGPVITLASVALIALLDRYVFPVPNPSAISFLAVVVSAYIGGIGSGLASAAISLAFAAWQFSLPGQPLRFDSDGLARLAVLAVCAPAIAILTGLLYRRAYRALERERAANQELKPLRSALDQSDVGIVLLDHELRAQFINRACRRLWRLPDEFADRKPAFVGLLYHDRKLKLHAVPDTEMDKYIATRMALVRAGDERPVDIRLSNGEVVRLRCKALSEGGRMLTYSNVSDLVRNADEMADLAMKDPLTNIYNRRHLLARLESEWRRYCRYRRPLSVMMLDIDYFKSVNDRFGHDAGDQVIKQIAGLAAAQTRDSDVAARIGGEEFAILMPETGLEQACMAAERLRRLVAERPIAYGNDRISVTITIGVAEANAGTDDAAALMKRADEALYAGKRAGRNRVMAAHGVRPPRVPHDLAAESA